MQHTQLIHFNGGFNTPNQHTTRLWNIQSNFKVMLKKTLARFFSIKFGTISTLGLFLQLEICRVLSSCAHNLSLSVCFTPKNWRSSEELSTVSAETWSMSCFGGLRLGILNSEGTGDLWPTLRMLLGSKRGTTVYRRHSPHLNKQRLADSGRGRSERLFLFETLKVSNSQNY